MVRAPRGSARGQGDPDPLGFQSSTPPPARSGSREAPHRRPLRRARRLFPTPRTGPVGALRRRAPRRRGDAAGRRSGLKRLTTRWARLRRSLKAAAEQRSGRARGGGAGRRTGGGGVPEESFTAGRATRTGNGPLPHFVRSGSLLSPLAPPSPPSSGAQGMGRPSRPSPRVFVARSRQRRSRLWS